jgi:hypothetical protein
MIIDPVLIALTNKTSSLNTTADPTTSAIQPMPGTPSPDLVLERSSGPTRSTSAREGE